MLSRLQLHTCLLLFRISFHHSVKWHPGEPVTTPPSGTERSDWPVRTPLAANTEQRRTWVTPEKWSTNLKTSTGQKTPQISAKWPDFLLEDSLHPSVVLVCVNLQLYVQGGIDGEEVYPIVLACVQRFFSRFLPQNPWGSLVELLQQTYWKYRYFSEQWSQACVKVY